MLCPRSFGLVRIACLPGVVCQFFLLFSCANSLVIDLISGGCVRMYDMNIELEGGYDDGSSNASADDDVCDDVPGMCFYVCKNIIFSCQRYSSPNRPVVISAGSHGKCRYWFNGNGLSFPRPSSREMLLGRFAVLPSRSSQSRLIFFFVKAKTGDNLLFYPSQKQVALKPSKKHTRFAVFHVFFLYYILGFYS